MCPGLASPDVSIAPLPGPAPGPAPMGATPEPPSLLAKGETTPSGGFPFPAAMEKSWGVVSSKDLVEGRSDFKAVPALEVKDGPAVGAEASRSVDVASPGPQRARAFAPEPTSVSKGVEPDQPADPGKAGPDGYPAGSGFMDRLKFHLMNNPEIVSIGAALLARVVANKVGFNLGMGGTVATGAALWGLMKFGKGFVNAPAK